MRSPLPLVGLLLSIGLSAASSAQAHAPAEVWHVVSSAADDVILATNRGLIFGDLNTRRWSLLCNEAFDVGVSLPYRTALLPSGRLLVASSPGLHLSDDRGCSWRDPAALGDAQAPYLLQDPNDRSKVYVATFQVGQGGVQLTSDGESYTRLLATSDDDYIGSLLLASSPGTPTHLYAGITALPPEGSPDNTPFQYFVQHSADGGQTWDRNPLTLTDSEVDLALLAVNPRDPLQLVARAVGSEPSLGERLLFSRDGGKSFSSPITIRTLRTASFSADGKTLYVGSVDGVLRADPSESELSFVAVGASSRVSSLALVSGELLACGYYQGDDAGLDGVGTMPITTATGAASAAFTRWLDFNEVQTPVDCPLPSDTNAKCAALFRDWRIENPPPLTQPDAGGLAADAGTGDAGTGDASSADASHSNDAALSDDAALAARKSSGGCALAHSAVPGGNACLLALALLLGVRGRRVHLRSRVRGLASS